MTDSKSKLTDLKDLLKPLPSELSEGDKQRAYDLYFAHQTQSFHEYYLQIKIAINNFDNEIKD